MESLTYNDFGILGSFAQIFYNFSYFINNWFERLFEKSVGQWLNLVFDLNLPLDWAVFEISLGTFMFGTGLTFFIGYSLVKWFIDILP